MGKYFFHVVIFRNIQKVNIGDLFKINRANLARRVDSPEHRFARSPSLRQAGKRVGKRNVILFFYTLFTAGREGRQAKRCRGE